MTVLWGVLILAGLGLILGFLLALAAKLLAVPEDPRIKEVEQRLPNANCGACGFAGCHDMAEALVKGEVKNVSRCKAGNKEHNYDPIIAYLNATPGPDGKCVKVTL